ncbi:MAG TPA: rod shape-determining protein MreD [Saprospiraceae bacterium]|nr:rod shape-determining protein MreD [Saprospiraceae bacterium]
MNNQLQSSIFRFIFVVIIQLLILKQIPIELANFRLLIFLYPLFIILMPTQSPKQLLIFLGFLIGIILDVFYDSPGVHAGAAVFTGYIRDFSLRLFGVDLDKAKSFTPSIAQIGLGKFAQVAAFILFFHIFVYYIFDVFTFVYLGEILIKTVGSFIVSYPLVLAYALIFNSKK